MAKNIFGWKYFRKNGSKGKLIRKRGRNKTGRPPRRKSNLLYFDKEIGRPNQSEGADGEKVAPRANRLEKGDGIKLDGRPGKFQKNFGIEGISLSIYCKLQEEEEEEEEEEDRMD